jgi:hypothetical protein
MSTSDYAPRPGTVAYRAITHLEGLAAGTELSTAELADVLGIDAKQMLGNLELAIKHGLVQRRQKFPAPRAPYFWSLVRRMPLASGSPGRTQEPAQIFAEQDEGGRMVQRIVPAASLPPAVTTGARSVFDMGGVDIDVVHRRATTEVAKAPEANGPAPGQTKAAPSPMSSAKQETGRRVRLEIEVSLDEAEAIFCVLRGLKWRAA